MPRKVRPPADTAQNRENQQRSRARRREYLASLEARVRDFETREVQATLAMQRAAREVAWVNERLMDLLAARGVTRDEVDEFLRRAGNEDVRRYADHGFGARGACEAGKDSSHGRDDVCESVANGAGTDMGMSASPHVADEYPRTICDGVSQTPKPQAENTSEGLSVHVTSCDDAAGIIAGFQGHGDVSHARKVLGCGDAANCHVKNTRLFQLMDETGCP